MIGFGKLRRNDCDRTPQPQFAAWIAANPLDVGNSCEQSGGKKSVEHRERTTAWVAVTLSACTATADGRFGARRSVASAGRGDARFCRAIVVLGQSRRKPKTNQPSGALPAKSIPPNHLEQVSGFGAPLRITTKSSIQSKLHFALSIRLLFIKKRAEVLKLSKSASHVLSKE